MGYFLDDGGTCRLRRSCCAESMMMDADFATEDFETLQEIVSRHGVADVKAFGITWDDCQKFLSRLGYQARVMVTESSVNAAVKT